MAGDGNEAKEIVTGIYLRKISGNGTRRYSILHLSKAENPPEISSLSKYKV
jgi:hypothetical protein